MKLNATPLSMVNPSTDSMLKQTHSRYALVLWFWRANARANS